jgi:hypothetical protein
MSTLHVTDGPRTMSTGTVPAAGGLAWFAASSLWLVALAVRLQGDAQVLVGPGVLALWAVAVLANLGWGVLLGRRAAWRALVTSIVVGAAVAVVAAVVWAVTAFAGSGDVNPEALWAVVPVLTVGVWAVLLAVLVLSALVGLRARGPVVSSAP